MAQKENTTRKPSQKGNPASSPTVWEQLPVWGFSRILRSVLTTVKRIQASSTAFEVEEIFRGGGLGIGTTASQPDFS